MKRKNKVLISIFLSLTMILYGIIPVAAADLKTDLCTLQDARTIALNAPAFFGYSLNWDITQETTLYTDEQQIGAYCFDMISSDISRRTAYVIVDAHVTNFPIMLFGIDGISPYYEKNFDRAYYFGTLNCFLKVDSVIHDARTDDVLDVNTFYALKDSFVESASTDSICHSTSSCSTIRSYYMDGYLSAPVQSTGTVSGAANLQWYKGCVPTSIAMLILTHFQALSSTNTIDSLAGYMNTSADGGTRLQNVQSGVLSYFSHNSNLTAPTTCSWIFTDSTGYPLTGATYNSTASFKASIDAGFPVGVHCSSSNVTTLGYPSGIGSHTMAGIGYSFGSSGNFVTCYTTNVNDGAVSFPLTSTGLADYAWFMLKW